MVRELTEDDVEFETMRSGGPGGQNVDSNATAVRVRVKVEHVPASEDEKDHLFENLPSRYVTKDEEIIVSNAETRSQAQNRKKALSILNEEIERAIEQGKRAEKQAERKESMTEGPGRSSGGGYEEDIREKQKRERRRESTDDLIEEAYREDPETVERYLRRDEDESEDSRSAEGSE